MSDAALNYFIARGTNAERLAFTPAPATPPAGPDQGYIWYETDTGDAYAWDGSAWDALVGASLTAASTTEILTGTNTTKGGTPDSIAALWEQGADIASAGTISIGEGGYFNITGTTTITDIDFATDKAGRKAWVKFAGILTLTHNASTLILPTGASITTAAGDTACFVSEGSDVVRCVAYNRASGAALVAGASGDPDPDGNAALSKPLAASFTLENAGTASMADGTNGLVLTAPSTTVNARFMRYTAGLPGASWTLTTRGRVIGPNNNTVHTRAIIVRNSTNGRLLTFADATSGSIGCQRWSGYTAAATTAFSYPASVADTPWRRVSSDGTTLTFSVSCDGEEWSIVGTEAIATYLTASGGGSLDQVGIGLFFGAASTVSQKNIFQHFALV